MAQTRLTQVAIKRANAADMLLPRVSLKINTVAMDRFAAIGTLGLSGREQYSEIFHNLLVAHELGHWLQEVARRPLSRWQAEYEANRIMVAFWREYPAQSKPLRRKNVSRTLWRRHRIPRVQCRTMPV